jgi:pantothenate kinase type III
LNSTPPIDETELFDGPCGVLGRHLPEQARKLIFGSEKNKSTKASAAETASMRRVPALSVYVISTNPKHEMGFSFLFQDVPSSIYKLSALDFFSKEDGVYDGIGVDRVAALRSARARSNSAPCLVLDAGTALTHTAMDRNGKIMGGGISPGVNSRFRAMNDHCGSLPLIEYKDYLKVMTDIETTKEPLPIFGKDTKTQMTADLFSELAGKCRTVVKHFLEETKTVNIVPPGDGVDATDVPPKPMVIVTGGDANLLDKLLRTDHSHLIKVEPNTMIPKPEEHYTLVCLKHLVHYGVGEVLKEEVQKANADISEDDKLRYELTGQRVVKIFDKPDYDGDYFYRGSIVSIQKHDLSMEGDWFSIRYDDGDSEQMDIIQVYGECIV